MISSLNENLFLLFHGLAGQSTFFDSVVIFFANPFGYLIIGFLFLALFLYFDGKPGVFHVEKRSWKIALVIGLTGVIAWAAALSLKEIFMAARPFIELENITPLFFYGGLDSFPSGHATFFSALATATYVYHKTLGNIYAVFAVCIGLSRIIVGIHYPIDIFAGFIIGFGGVAFMYFVMKKVFGRTKLHPDDKLFSF